MTSHDSRIQVTRQPDARAADECEWVWAESYASLEDDSLVRAVRRTNTFEILRSEDGARSWRTVLSFPRKPLLEVETFYLDPGNGRLVCFLAANTGTKPQTRRLFTIISRDGGRTWGARAPLMADSALVLEGRRLETLTDGTIVAPCYLWPTEARMHEIFRSEHRPRELCDDAQYFQETVCLLGRWRDEQDGIEWEQGGRLLVPGGYTSAGTCGSDEPTIAFLDDGRWLCVVRTSTSHVKEFRERNIPALRYCAVSVDCGRTWGEARPLTFDDGSPVYSPSAYSEFVRSSKNGAWHWVGNILPHPSYGNCDPRHPLQIAELDAASLALKRDTVTVIQDIEPGDPAMVRFSNFHIREERGTGDFILLMTKSYCELVENWQTLPMPSWRYRIRLPQ